MEPRPALVWFRGHDLRVRDNLALAAAVDTGAPVFALFVHHRAPVSSFIQKWYLHHALAALHAELAKLNVVLLVRDAVSQPHVVAAVADIATALSVRSVIWNRAYGVSGADLDAQVRAHLEESGVMARELAGAELLLEPQDCARDAPRQFADFHSYARFWLSRFEENPPPIPLPPVDPACVRGVPTQEIMQKMSRSGLIDVHIDSDWERWFRVESLHLLDGISETSQNELRRLRAVGCIDAEQTLQNFLNSIKFRQFSSSEARRDALVLRDKLATSCLSPHVRFGEISPRLLYHAVLDAAENQSGVALSSARRFLKNVCLREFGYYILWRFPDASTKPIIKEFEVFPWEREDRERRNTAWERGTTGFPIVDAAMRQLAAEGWIHNRLRFLAASFYCKYLLLPWPHGAKYMFRVLVDGDEACNSLGWQWTAGCNSDSFPFSTLVNPVTMFKRSRSISHAANYIRKYVPELAGLPDKLIFKPWQASEEQLVKANLAIVPQKDFKPVGQNFVPLNPNGGLSEVQGSFLYPMRIINCPDARQRARKSMELMRRIFASQRPSRPIVVDQSFVPPEHVQLFGRRRNSSMEAMYSSTTYSTLMLRRGNTSFISDTVATSSQGHNLLENLPNEEHLERLQLPIDAHHCETKQILGPDDVESGRVKASRSREDQHSESSLERQSKRARNDGAPDPYAPGNEVGKGSDVVVRHDARSSDALSISGLSYSPVLSDRPQCNVAGRSFSTDLASSAPRQSVATTPDLVQLSLLAATKTPDLATRTRQAQSPSSRSGLIAVPALLSPSNPRNPVAEVDVLVRKAQIEAFRKSLDPASQEPSQSASDSAAPVPDKNLVRPCSPEAVSTTSQPSKRARPSSSEDLQGKITVGPPPGYPAAVKKSTVEVPADEESNISREPVSSSQKSRAATESQHTERSQGLPTAQISSPAPATLSRSASVRSQPGRPNTESVAHNDPKQNPHAYLHPFPPTPMPSRPGDPRQFCAPANVAHIPSPLPHDQAQMYQRNTTAYYPPASPSASGYTWRLQFPGGEGGNYAQPVHQQGEHHGYHMLGPHYVPNGASAQAPANYHSPYADPRAYAERRGYPDGFQRPPQNVRPQIMHQQAVAVRNHAMHSTGLDAAGHPHAPHTPHAAQGSSIGDGRHAVPPGMAFNVQYQAGPYRSDLPLHHGHGHVGHQMTVAPMMVVPRFPSGPAPVQYPMIGVGTEMQPRASENQFPVHQQQVSTGQGSRGSGASSAAPTDRVGRMEVARRMAAMDYDDPKLDGKHKEQWQAIALHLINKYEFCDDTDRQTSKSYVRLCVIKDQLREANQNGPRVTVNHCKQVFGILQLPVTGEWDRRGHGGVRGPYVYGLRPKQSS